MLVSWKFIVVFLERKFFESLARSHPNPSKYVNRYEQDLFSDLQYDRQIETPFNLGAVRNR
jgi:hypothetical protein